MRYTKKERYYRSINQMCKTVYYDDWATDQNRRRIG